MTEYEKQALRALDRIVDKLDWALLWLFIIAIRSCAN